MARKKSAAGTRAGRGRRGNGESFTGAKENEVEVRTAGIGDNSLKLPAPDDFDHHLKSIRGAKDKAATANSFVRHAKTAANKCSPGLAAVIEETLSIERENDPVKLQRHLEMLGMGLKRINSSVQLSVFDTLQGDQEEMVEERFYKAGKEGKPFDCKYPAESDLHTLAQRSWTRGQAEILGVDVSELDQAPTLEVATQH